jgi:hypothetical protein
VTTTSPFAVLAISVSSDSRVRSGYSIGVIGDARPSEASCT